MLTEDTRKNLELGKRVREQIVALAGLLADYTPDKLTSIGSHALETRLLIEDATDQRQWSVVSTAIIQLDILYRRLAGTFGEQHIPALSLLVSQLPVPTLRSLEAFLDQPDEVLVRSIDSMLLHAGFDQSPFEKQQTRLVIERMVDNGRTGAAIHFLQALGDVNRCDQQLISDANMAYFLCAFTHGPDLTVHPELLERLVTHCRDLTAKSPKRAFVEAHTSTQDALNLCRYGASELGHALLDQCSTNAVYKDPLALGMIEATGFQKMRKLITIAKQYRNDPPGDTYNRRALLIYFLSSNHPSMTVQDINTESWGNDLPRQLGKLCSDENFKLNPERACQIIERHVQSNPSILSRYRKQPGTKALVESIASIRRHLLADDLAL